jgi:hypothetical protein
MSYPLKLYVAGKWGDKAVIASVIRIFEMAGHEITHNWTHVEEEDKKSDTALQMFAEMDIEGVTEADCMIAVITDMDYPYRGTCTEMGAALALKKKVFVIDFYKESGFSSNIFINHPLVTRFKNITSVIEALRVICDECSRPAGRYERCVDCDTAICTCCVGAEYYTIDGWCEIKYHCVQCKKMVCECCVTYCIICALLDNSDSYCNDCTPETFTENNCDKHSGMACNDHRHDGCFACENNRYD